MHAPGPVRFQQAIFTLAAIALAAHLLDTLVAVLAAVVLPRVGPPSLVHEVWKPRAGAAASRP